MFDVENILFPNKTLLYSEIQTGDIWTHYNCNPNSIQFRMQIDTYFIYLRHLNWNIYH